ncbi:hypothetical protein RERY_38610 [Rhodococcus erythropolis]|nr:hypothetical protein [Rhodococcus erythropolis]OFV75557.1 hypothetical protein RERY_38610 [Rhodococcus erythropolis]
MSPARKVGPRAVCSTRGRLTWWSPCPASAGGGSTANVRRIGVSAGYGRFFRRWRTVRDTAPRSEFSPYAVASGMGCFWFCSGGCAKFAGRRTSCCRAGFHRSPSPFGSSLPGPVGDGVRVVLRVGLGRSVFLRRAAVVRSFTNVQAPSKLLDVNIESTGTHGGLGFSDYRDLRLNMLSMVSVS